MRQPRRASDDPDAQARWGRIWIEADRAARVPLWRRLWRRLCR